MGQYAKSRGVIRCPKKFPKKISKMSTAWQRNLRRSDVSGQVKPKIKNEGIHKKVSEIPTARQNVRRPKLKSVSEIEDVFGDENVGKKIIVPRGNRRRLSTQGSVSELDNVPSKSRDVQEQKTPTKITKAYNFLRPIQPFSVSEDGIKVKNIPSPIPLPKGVANIDPHDDSCQIYGRDIFNYVLTRDARYVVTTKDISNDADPKLHDRRESLVDWLMSVAHHHKTSQETFYHTVDILDRCLAKTKFKPEHLQLLGVASFLIATKLDEYHPANINDLCRLTENSVTQDKMLAMEQKILMTINFETYGTEPMTFIRRYLKAAQLSHRIYKGSPTYELSILFMDAMVLKLWDDDQDARTSKKAAVAVFTALVLTDVEATEDLPRVEKIWTPNMKHYVWKNYQDLIPMSKCMLNILKTILRDSQNDFALTAKYKSVSRHGGLLQKLNPEWVDDVDKLIKTL